MKNQQNTIQEGSSNTINLLASVASTMSFAPNKEGKGVRATFKVGPNYKTVLL